MKPWVAWGAIPAGFLVLALAAISQSVSIFVVQPIGAVPNGVTVIISKVDNVGFVDSPDAICERRLGGVSLMCRGMVAARVAGQATIFARLPYSDWLYRYSTGGKTYER